jgi:uncharacterized membrane protein YedE/YeeE
MSTRHVVFGLVFGFVLVRAGASSYDAIAGMFLLRDLHLVGVIGVAIATAALGFVLLRRARVRARTGEPLALAAKPMQKGLVLGGLLFGVGWAISGTCPGTALAQVGEGRLAGVFTLAGILMGAWLQQRRAAAIAGSPPAGASVARMASGSRP